MPAYAWYVVYCDTTPYAGESFSAQLGESSFTTDYCSTAKHSLHPTKNAEPLHVRWWMKPAMGQPSQNSGACEIQAPKVSLVLGTRLGRNRTSMVPWVVRGGRQLTAHKWYVPAWRYMRSFHELHIPPVLLVVPEYMCNSCALFY